MPSLHGLEQFRLTDRAALITGSTKGLGLAMARALAEAGADVAVNSRHADECSAVADRLAAETRRRVVALPGDVAVRDDCDRLIDRTVDRLGRLDILINNAGINIRKPIGQWDDAEWRRIVDVNLSGPFYLCRAAHPHLKAAGRGRVINMASTMAVVSIPGRTGYSATKAGLMHMTRTLALEWAADKITVNAILPGPFKTPLNEEIMRDPEKYKTFAEQVPLGRWAEPEEIGGLAIYLASDASAFMTGSAILIDGGWTSR
jgi:NAD(P)-dependent dehydrogenase (short-subunit alcohol dehydrogenase family)